MTSKTNTINTQRWAQIQRVFDAAMDVDAGQRTAFISDKCGDDENLRNQVEALMLAADSDEDLVSDLVHSATSNFMGDKERISQPIGQFKLIEAIGEGGMGVVYLARRDDQEFFQEVAIKVLHKRVLSEETQARFLAERQILADLNHPNIARLLDGGQTEDGQPYIVMEYIDGAPLIEYCDQHQLSIDARLKLFQQVCSAVAEAHRSLIVHRDIKSNNILVGRDGTPKLLDFGIAKVLGDHLGEIDLAKTQQNDRLLTPDSASPEQITGRTITTATDIYSLGILLYELLSGCRPFRLSFSSAGEMEKTICNENPLPPSAALEQILEQDGGNRESTAQNRMCTFNRLRSRLRGELDSIVLMALKKEPRRRYRSANEFADDIERFFKGEPIQAIRDSRSYRAIKFIRRNLVPLAAATVFVSAVSVFGITNYIQSNKIAAQAQNIAIQSENLEDTLGFLSNVFRAASPEGLQKKEPSALDILNFAEQEIVEDLADRPIIMGRLLQTIASAYDGQQQKDKALNNYEAALSLINQSYGPNHPYTADILQDLGRHYWNRDWNKASAYYAQALNVLNEPATIEHFGGNTARHLTAIQKLLRDMAELEMAQGKWTDAENHANEALTISQSLDSNAQSSTQVAYNLSVLAALYLRLGKLELSDTHFTRALKEFKLYHDSKHTFVADLLDGLASTKHSLGDMVAAEKLYREALSINESVFDSDDPRLLIGKAVLGRFLGSQGKLEQGRALLQEATTKLQTRPNQLTQELAFYLVQLATIETQLHNFLEAENLLDNALEIYSDTIEADHNFVGEAYHHYGLLRIEQNQHESAVNWLDDALTILLKRVGEDHWRTARTRSEKAEALIQLGLHADAKDLLDSATPMLKDMLGEEHRLYIKAMSRLERVSLK